MGANPKLTTAVPFLYSWVDLGRQLPVGQQKGQQQKCTPLSSLHGNCEQALSHKGKCRYIVWVRWDLAVE